MGNRPPRWYWWFATPGMCSLSSCRLIGDTRRRRFGFVPLFAAWWSYSGAPTGSVPSHTRTDLYQLCLVVLIGALSPSVIDPLPLYPFPYYRYHWDTNTCIYLFFNRVTTFRRLPELVAVRSLLAGVDLPRAQNIPGNRGHPSASSSRTMSTDFDITPLIEQKNSFSLTNTIPFVSPVQKLVTNCLQWERDGLPFVVQGIPLDGQEAPFNTSTDWLRKLSGVGGQFFLS